ncbi:Methyltransferase [Spiroplasma clarkii]|uniref:methyltransferase n=1 Tax=Spiroplasma clarkii TaxID=2139 RepID=UPI000B55A490|nr:methyltransferase [Spiroplasma clarkii]ARU90896.1 Methyltransferase [Spiroplasma clarkii]
MFSFSLDSILLARFYTPKKSDKLICDFGTNNGIIPLILSCYTNDDSKIIGVEINTEAAALAKENLELNKLTNKVEIVNEDIKEFIKNKIIFLM